jgi:hypothetical protein
MQGASYFRAQAELCLQIARQMSDATLAERLRDNAAQHFARAVESEARSGTPFPSRQNHLPPPNNGSALVRRFFFPVEYDGVIHQDETGEMFLTRDEAESYAEVVACELGKNNHKSVEVILVGDDGTELGRYPGGNNSGS